MTHFKNFFNDRFLNSGDVDNNKDTVVEIINVFSMKDKTADGEKNYTAVGLVGFDKPMKAPNIVLKDIYAALGTAEVEEWHGKKISIYIAKGQVHFGKVHDLIRVRTVAPRDREVDLQPHIDALTSAADLASLVGLWKSLGGTLQAYPKVLKAKDSRKKALEQLEKQPTPVKDAAKPATPKRINDKK